MGRGALSGKYDTKHPMSEGSARAEIYNPVLDKLEILNAELKKLADKYSVGMAQIPVAWAIAKGTLPIIGVTKENQVLDAVMSVGFLLIGAAVMLLVRSTIYGFLIGALIAGCGNFVMLLMKYKGVSVK